MELSNPSNDGLVDQLTAAQPRLPPERQESLHRLGFRINISATSVNPPNQWASPVGRIGDTHALMSLPSHPRPRRTSLPRPVSSTEDGTELALTYSKKAEGWVQFVEQGHDSFPMVLHRLLAELEFTGDGKNIATFLPDGRSFSITNQPLFESDILPAFFPKMKGFGSFQPQLNLYQFKRIRSTGRLDPGAWRHELFLRDCPAMACRMRLTKVKGIRRRGPPKSSKKEV
jgi:hypothetical protein